MTRSLLSKEEVALWHAWKHAHEAVMNGVARDLQAHAGVSGADFGVLSRLVDLGGGVLRQQELADLMKWEKSRLSHQLSRMEERGLVERRRVSGKLVHVRIARRGRAALDAARLVHAASVRKCLLDTIPQEDRSPLLSLLARLSSAAS